MLREGFELPGRLSKFEAILTHTIGANVTFFLSLLIYVDPLATLVKPLSRCFVNVLLAEVQNTMQLCSTSILNCPGFPQPYPQGPSAAAIMEINRPGSSLLGPLPRSNARSGR